MIETIESIANLAAHGSEIKRPATAGPLFKEIYTGFIDVENPAEWQPLLAGETRSLLAHTTDVQSLAQFRSLHHVPEKWGTQYHHQAYLRTAETLGV
ncbi:hypothetical protein OAC78_01770 [Litorivicinus sp.]|nr:hypothetical protein [Litorivicinus sp.]MDB9862082.1 hypothetical protein [Litorivicinus sp.]MDC1208239.1 hypothetical protein [Litorivicinus sp.]MDC1240500.1 hypothetical protein [Litorivicinus sp.]MDC1466096.1 hypothetical protein [Litorivicinus sp.]